MGTPTRTEIELGRSHFKDANARVRTALETADEVVLSDVNAQRYLGCALPTDKRLFIYGTPGNDLGCYMDGGTVEVFGDGQDQVGNTMNSGTITIHGRCGDATGYALRGGTILVRDNCGWRAGINMKQYEDRRPAIVIGGDAGAFLGEYMAGGVIVLAGCAGDYVGSGMHGGIIYVRHPLDEERIMDGLIQEAVSIADEPLLAELLAAYDCAFANEAPPLSLPDTPWYRLRPATARPYSNMYAH